MSARKAIAETASATPQVHRPKPSLHLDASDITGGERLHVGETVTLIATGKVTSISEEETGDESKDTRRHLSLRLTSVKVRDDAG